MGKTQTWGLVVIKVNLLGNFKSIVLFSRRVFKESLYLNSGAGNSCPIRCLGILIVGLEVQQS